MVNITDMVNKLRDLYNDDHIEDVANLLKLDDLINLFHKNIQKATFEQPALELAEGLVGYKFYIPPYMDFRGRNYRHGIFHLHKRDHLADNWAIVQSDFDRTARSNPTPYTGL